MNAQSCIRVAAIATATSILFFPARTSGQSTGRVEFSARVEPTGGQPEPVRQLTFYLLRKSVGDIRKEVAQTGPAPDLDKYIDGLSVSPALKAWMHKHQSVRLTGEEFVKSLTADDIVDTPEFLKAYMTHNEAYRGMGFPEPKYKEKDKTANPEKYKDQKDEYEAAVRKFIAEHLGTDQGMDLELVDMNPYPAWQDIERKHRQSVEARAFQIAAQRYAVARTETDLDGHGSFSGIAPGNYWIATFGAEAISGDVHLRWDVPVTVGQGQLASIELSNVNAAQSSAAALNSDY